MRIWSVWLVGKNWPAVIVFVEECAILGIIRELMALMRRGLVWFLIVRIMMVLRIERIVLLVIPVV